MYVLANSNWIDNFDNPTLNTKDWSHFGLRKLAFIQVLHVNCCKSTVSTVLVLSINIMQKSRADLHSEGKAVAITCDDGCQYLACALHSRTESCSRELCLWNGGKVVSPLDGV